MPQNKYKERRAFLNIFKQGTGIDRGDKATILIAAVLKLHN